MEKIRAAIVGGSEDGKTFFSTGLSRGLWNHFGFRSLAFDPYKGETPWGPQALVFGASEAERAAGRGDEANLREFDRFKRTVFSVRVAQKFAVFWDEGTSTGGRDSDNTNFFTAIRHNSAAFFFIGHSYATMLPTMRGSLTDVFLAARDPDDAKQWAAVMCDPSLRDAAQSLKQYEFLHKRKHRPAKVLRYSKAEILRGITP